MWRNSFSNLQFYNRSIYRENEDLEFSIDYDQKDIWINFLEENEFKFEKHASDWPLGNKKIVFRSKIALKIELILLKDNKIDKDILKINIKNLNINIFSPFKVLTTKFSYIRHDKKEIRSKDKLDILYFKQYFIDNVKN